MVGKSLAILNLTSSLGNEGADHLAINIARGLKQKGHRIYWGAPAESTSLIKAKADGFGCMDFYPAKKATAAECLKLVQFCKNNQIDIINTHHSHARHFITWAKRYGLKAKIIFTRHSVMKSIPLIGGFYYNFIANMNIAVSRGVRKSLLTAGIFSSKVAVVNGGISLESFEQVSEEKILAVKDRYFSEDCFNIAIVARFLTAEPFQVEKPLKKGHERVLQALASLERNFKLFIIGASDQADQEKLHKLADHYGFDKTKLISCGFQQDVAPFYKNLHLNILPSANEGLPLSLMEAMASSVACIAMDSGGSQDIITHGKNGFLIPLGDTEKMRQAIVQLMDDEVLRQSFIQAGLETVRQQFSIEKTIENTEHLILSLMVD